MRQYWMCKFCLDEKQRFFIWYTDEKDGVIVAGNHQLVTFDSELDAARFAASRKIPLEDGAPAFFDLEQVSSWCKLANADAVDCEGFLNAWNLLDDISLSCNEPPSLFGHISKRENDLYNKLFFGNNLPAITPVGEYYEPEWSEVDIKRLKEVLEFGLMEFRNRLSPETV